MIKLIKFLFVGLLILTISCLSGEKKSNQSKFKNQDINQEQPTLLKAEVIYEDMYTTTFVSITCEGFEKKFTSLIKKKTLTGLEQVLKLENFINQTLTSNIKTEIIDVRVKAKLFYSDNSNKEFCLGLHSLQDEGIKYSISNEFREYLLQITETAIP